MGERKKISLTELDESSIVASFKEEQPAQAVPPTVEPETPAPRQTEQPDSKPAHESEYLRLFIHESPVCARLGKTIYLRKEFHERIQRIVQTIGEGVPRADTAHRADHRRQPGIIVQLRGQRAGEAFCRLAGGHRARIQATEYGNLLKNNHL